MRFDPFSLTAKQIFVDVNGSPLFEPADVNIQNGQALIIKGENGVGKTTLLRVLAGLLGPSGGDITVTGEGVSGHYLGHSNGLKAAQTVICSSGPNLTARIIKPRKCKS